jgi:hypothetical protein
VSYLSAEQVHSVEELLTEVERFHRAELPAVIHSLEDTVADETVSAASRASAELMLAGVRAIAARGNWRDGPVAVAREEIRLARLKVAA